MPWTRSDKSVAVELSRTQDWIENTDVDLYGRNGERGIVREHREDRASLKGILALLSFLTGSGLVIQILHMVGWVK